jgi:hypothetical protein
MKTQILPYPDDPRYRVSDQGDVLKNGRKLKGDIKRQDGKPPYRRIRIDRHWHYVHDMVLKTFKGPKPKGRCVRHRNGVSLDNRFRNLQYSTYHWNNMDRVKHGHHFRANQTKCIRGHEFTPENTYINTVSGCRECKACKGIRRRAKRARATQLGA